MTSQLLLKSMLSSAARLFSGHDSKIARRITTVLSESQDKLANVDSHRSLVEDVMLESLQPSDDDFFNDILSCHHQLSWRRPGFGKIPPGIAKKIAVVELLGPDGMIYDEACRFGLLFQEKNTLYPEHKHAAEELYFIIAGSADWAVDGGKSTSRGVGQFIHHTEYQAHEMRTDDEPLLAMWGWTGNLSSTSYSL